MYLLRCLELIPKFHSLFRATEAYRLKQELDNAREREKDARGRLMEITQQSVLHDKVFFFIYYIENKATFSLLSFKLSLNLFVVLQTFKISGWYTVVHQQGRIIIYCEEKRRTRPATWKLTVSPFNSLVMIFISVPITVRVIIISSDINDNCVT